MTAALLVLSTCQAKPASRPSDMLHSKGAVVWPRWPFRMRCRPSNHMHSVSAVVWPRWTFPILRVPTIGSEAFLGCSSLASVVFPDALHTIEMGAFLGCSSLASVVFPDALHTIGEYAFADCSDLKALIFLRTSPMSQVGEGVFEWVMPTNVFYAGAKLELVGGILPCSPTLEAPCVESASKSDLELLQDLQQSC